MTDEELKEIAERVEKAKPYGEGVGTLALGDVPKLLAEIERLRKIDEGARLLLEQVEGACGKSIPQGAFTAGRWKLKEALA